MTRRPTKRLLEAMSSAVSAMLAGEENQGDWPEDLPRSKWRWPEGYKHYIEDHNVKPSDEFYNFIMGNAR